MIGVRAAITRPSIDIGVFIPIGGIQCGLVKPDFLVEIATIAHIGKR